MPSHRKSVQKLRMEIARTAAKMIAVDGVNDYALAKKKAAEQLGIHQQKHMPANTEIEQALIDYQRLFLHDDQQQHLKSLRQTAVQAMLFVKQFAPRLTGPVLTGTATKHSAVTLHLFCDETEQVSHYLNEQGVPYTHSESTIRVSPSQTNDYPAFCFVADDTSVVLTVFPKTQQFEPALSPIDGRPVRRAELKEVQGLI